MKRGKLEPGDVLELHRDGRYGYCRSLGRDKFGVLVEVFDFVSETSVPIGLLERAKLPRKCVCYVNEASAKKAWRYVGEMPLGLLEACWPPVFNGHPDYGWTIFDGESERRLSARDATESDLISRGFIPRILWLATNLEDALFDGKELHWKWDV